MVLQRQAVARPRGRGACRRSARSRRRSTSRPHGFGTALMRLLRRGARPPPPRRTSSAFSASARRPGAVESRQALLHAGNRDGRDRELGHAETDQDRRADRVGRQLPADRDRAVHRLARLDDHPDHPQDRGVQGPVEPGDVGVGPVDRQPVLRQVVGADREEVRFRGQPVRQQGRRRDLDHHPERRAPWRGRPARDALEERARGLQLRERSDHGQQDTQVAAPRERQSAVSCSSKSSGLARQ